MGIKRFKAALLSILIVTSFAAFLLVATTAKPPATAVKPPEEDLCGGGDPIENFLPTDDSHIMEGYPDTVQENGKKYNLYIGWDEEEYLTERVYLKFDLSKIPAGTVNYAYLHLYNKYCPSDGPPDYNSCTMVIDAKEVSDDSWQENALTWNNAPSMGTGILDSQTLEIRDELDPKKIPPEDWEWETLDVTSYVVSEVAGDKTVSIGLMSQNEGTDDCAAWFYAKDAHETQPRAHLEVSWRGVGVSISPSEKKGSRGDELTFTVTITNEVGSEDTFTLTVDSEWAASLSSYTVGPISNLGSEDVTLTVTIPDDACLGSEDEITVTARSRDVNPEIFDSDTCIAGVPPIYPSDDAGVNKFDPSSNFGDNLDIIVGTRIEEKYWSDEDWRGYLKFDLSEDIPDESTIDSAYLSIFTKYGGENGAQKGVEEWEKYGDATLTVDAKKVEDDLWSEASITWNNKPNMSDVIDSVVIPPLDEQRYQWDVTSYVQEEWGGDKEVGIGLVSEQEGQNKFVPFYSKEREDVSRRPYLIVCYSENVAPGPGVSVSISPDENSDAPGDAATFTVTVTNTGTITDSFTLGKSDTADWTLDLPSSSGSLTPGDSVNKTLTVTIPSTAGDGDSTTVTVTATSDTDPSASDLDTCIARAAAPGPGVSVSISPEENSGAPGDAATFTVTVTNTGTITDSFTLGKSDTADWTLDLPSSSGSLTPGDSVNKTLTVTIPSTAGDGDSTTVTVTATSTENSEVSDFATCTARAVIGVGGVEVTIGPTTDSGSAGEELAYLVTIKNTGGLADTYTLEAANDWDVEIAGGPYSLDPGGSRSGIRLTVTIPEDAAEGVSTTITVTATGTGYDDSATCTAEVKAAGGIPLIPVVGVVVVVVVIIGVILVIRH